MWISSKTVGKLVLSYKDKKKENLINLNKRQSTKCGVLLQNSVFNGKTRPGFIPLFVLADVSSIKVADVCALQLEED